jgi:hypothetical protein
MTRSANNIPEEYLGHLTKMKTFLVSTCRRSPDGDGIIAAHSMVIRPLLASASEAYLWPASTDRASVEFPSSILIRERNRYKLDLMQDVLSGHERFWNAGGGRRGEIVIRLKEEPPNLVEIFMHCSPPCVLSSRYQLTRDGAQAAVRYCDKCISDNDIAFYFSSSNGIQHLSVFAPESKILRLFQTALDYGRPFKRWFECLPGECVNLVGTGEG